MSGYRGFMEDVRADRQHVDGNAVGGLLSQVFGREATADQATCDDCGNTNPVGGLVVFNCAPGAVLRCPGCGAVLFVVVRKPGGYRLTFDRLRSLQVGEV